MIPKLYESNGEVLIGSLHNGIKGITTEERNGLFEIEYIYPYFAPHIEKIIRGNIIVADANDKLKNQKFRIYRISKPISGKVTILARHISYDLLRDFIENVTLENQSCEYALNSIFRASQFSKHFVGVSDIINAQNFSISDVDALKAIAGTRGSILDTYGTGAELLRDNTTIKVLNKRGHDNGVTIEYKKNLTGFNYTLDETGLITRIRAFAKKREENEEVIVYSNPRFIDSPKINDYETPFIQAIDFSEEFDDKNPPTPEKLRLLAEKYFIDNKCDIPKMNYKIEFVPLSKCAGYEGIEDQIGLCDLVTIKNSMYNITTITKVIKTKYDFLKDKYESMELGEAKTTLSNVVGSGGEGKPGRPGADGKPGADGNMGDFPDSLPPVPQVTATVYGFASVELKWTYESKPYYNYELYASKTENFEPNIFNLIFSGQASAFLHQVKPSEAWYYKARAVNSHSKFTEYSTQVKAVTRKVDDMSNYFEEAAIGRAVVGALTADYMTVGILKGHWIDARNLSVTDGNGKRTLDIDSDGNVNLDVNSLSIRSQKVNTEFEVIEKIQKAVKEYGEEVDVKFQEANNNLGALEGYMEGAFHDGIINASEAKSLRGLLDVIKQDKAVIDKEYSTLYSNNYLVDNFKQLLYNTKNIYNSAFSNYENKLSLIINKDSVTEEEQREINTLGNTYRESIKNYKDTVIQCLDSITSKRVEELSSTVTDRFVRIETENGEIKNTVQGITSDIVDINGEVQKRVTETSFTQFKQEYNKFQINVTTKYGFENIIKNSGFLYGYTYFNKMQNDYDGVGEIHIMNDEDPWVLTGTCAANIRGGNFSTGTFGLRQEGFKLKPNTTYTLALTASSHRCQWRASITTKGWGQLAYLEGIKEGGKDPNNWDNLSYTFTTGTSSEDLSYCRLDLLVQNPNGHNAQAWFTNIRLVEGDYAPKWSPKSGETYSNKVTLDEDNFKLMFENGNYAQLGRLGLEQQIGTMAYPYHCLGWAKAIGIPAGNPGKVNVRLPDEFDHCAYESINWSVAQRGYYFSTSHAFFPFYVQVEGARLFKHTDGHWYVEIHGYSRIQNANNSGDVQNMPNGVNAMLTVNA
ncbi:phage tail spike protein [Clostridium perfringens]|uniref:phage tail spike protein n=1 Tax=Clostridium perfringens TaxID=1502 RepID=UPI000F54C17C|nr:phage tail spike protein [Clostridium perfringens]